ncbi:MAG TPA: hypothetical protein VH592_21090 [Gemmataceae bacterium]|jgi:hypothetical protein
MRTLISLVAIVAALLFVGGVVLIVSRAFDLSFPAGKAHQELTPGSQYDASRPAGQRYYRP